MLMAPGRFRRRARLGSQTDRPLIGSSVDRNRLERLSAARHHAWGLERLGFALLTAAIDAERGSSEPERR
jgi:hypothetical protein